MASQFQIEQAAGITDQAIAEHIMAEETPAARSAMSLLRLQVTSYDPGGFALLKDAVAACRAEMRIATKDMPHV